MKKTIGLLFAVALMFAVPGCSSSTPEVVETDAAKLQALEQQMEADDAAMNAAMEGTDE